MKKKYTLSEDGFQYDSSNKWFFLKPRRKL